MTRNQAIDFNKNLRMYMKISDKTQPYKFLEENYIALDMAIKALEQELRKGEWLRMSDLSEQEDDRYKCSCCGNVIHHRDKMDLYTFNSWCGRCGSDNRRKIEVSNDQLYSIE